MESKKFSDIHSRCSFIGKKECDRREESVSNLTIDQQTILSGYINVDKSIQVSRGLVTPLQRKGEIKERGNEGVLTLVERKLT